MTGTLERLLRPKSLAVVGGGAWGRNVVANSRKGGFEGALWPVHPARAEVAGVPAFPALADLPAPPDVAYVAVSRDKTIEVVRELAAMGCGGAVCLASGFLEAEAEDAGGRDLQRRLLEAAGDMPILGPNCYGFVNYLDGAVLWPDQHGGARVGRGVAIVGQSSNMAINITMQRRGLPLAYMITAGNQAQQGLAALGAAVLEDARVTVLGLHIEGIGDIRAFEALAVRARALGKPIVALKVGRSEAAQAATLSHTASLAGSDAGAAALLDRLGIARVQSLPAFLEALKLLCVAGPLASNRIASLSCSGGEASLMADTGLGRDLVFPPLDAGQKAALRAALGPMVALANPLDYHTYIWRNPAKIAETFGAMMSGDLGLGLIILDFPRADRCDPQEWYDVTAGAAAAMQATGRPMGIVATLPECMPEEEAAKLVAAGVVPLAGLDEALAAVEAAARAGRVRAAAEPVLLPGPDRDARLIGEAEAKAELAKHGLAVPNGRVAGDAEAARALADAIGYPVVLKGLGLAHKSEAGAVHVGLKDGAAVEAAARAIGGAGFLVEETIGGGVVELLIGVVRDPAHGFVLTLGAGGQLTELLADSVSLLVPADRDAVDAALRRLRCSRLIAGYRGLPPADRTAILDAAMAVQAYVIANAGRVSEVEVNPLIATPGRAVAVDALLRRTE